MTIELKKASINESLYLALKNQIKKGVLRPGDRLLSTRELQQKFQLSYHAALAGLKQLEREGLVERRPGAGTFVTAQATPRIHGRTIGVMLLIRNEFTELFMRPLVRTLKKELSDLGCNYSLEMVELELGGEVGKLRPIGEADCFIWVCPSLPLTLGLPKVPSVFVAHDLEVNWSETSGYDIVTANSRQGAALAGRYMRERGCKHVALLGAGAWVWEPERPSPYTILRRLGFEDGWGERVPESRVFVVRGHVPEHGARAVNDILALKPRPDAVLR